MPDANGEELPRANLDSDPGAAQLSTRPNVAFYSIGGGGFRDWWTLLHPPYTAWHLSYVVIGACLAPSVDLNRLLATLLGFFLAVGIGAHALDELHGRPLRTEISSSVLVGAMIIGISGAIGLGVIGVVTTGWELIPFIVIGPALVLIYNAELFGGLLHTKLGFSAAWGAFPVLTAYVAQSHRISVVPFLAAFAAVALSFAQQCLSTPARDLRRRVTDIHGVMNLQDGSSRPIRRDALLDPLETTLRALCVAVVCLSAALAVARLT